MNVKPLAAIYYAAFGGYSRTIRFLDQLIRSLIISAVGIAEEICLPLEPLLQTLAAFQNFRFNFIGT
jgi:hypothetical protein